MDQWHPSPPRTLREEILEGTPLKEREVEALAMAAQGDSAKEAGARLFLAEETVKTYRKRAIARLAARNITHAVTIALCRGLIECQP